MSKQQNTFIDNDGTLIEPPSRLSSRPFEQKTKIRTHDSSLLALQDAGYRLVMVTNQEMA